MEIVGYLLILSNLLLNLVEGVTVKRYASRHGSGGMLMNAVISLFSCIFFIITDTDGFNPPPEIWIFGIVSMAMYATGFYTALVAYRLGPFGLTRLISNFSIVFPMVYGIVILGDATTPFTYVGLVAIFTSITLINLNGGKDAGESNIGGEKSRKKTAKWLAAITACTVSNGLIAVITKMQQLRFNDAASKEFKIISLGGSFIILLLIGLFTERENIGSFLRSGLPTGAFCGVINGVKNLFTLIIYLYLPISIVSPMSTGLGIVISFLAALLLYKERYSKKQKIGVLIGAAAVVLFALK